MKIRLTTLCENTSSGVGIIAEWGLSILVEAGGETVLLDTGGSDSVLRNAVTMGVDLKKISHVVISHGHVDHTGGLRPLLQTIQKDVKVTGHPDMWGKKYVLRSAGDTSRYDYIGIPFCREELKNRGASFILSKEPVWLNEYMVTTGEVPMLTSFEKIDQNMYVREDDRFVPDPLADDQALVIKTDKGLVIVLGCAHRGMINTIMQAQKITGVEKVYAVVGGTHLIRAGSEQLRQTVNIIKEMGIEKLGVSHCTGLPAAMVLAGELGDRFFFNHAGTVVEL